MAQPDRPCYKVRLKTSDCPGYRFATLAAEWNKSATWIAEAPSVDCSFNARAFRPECGITDFARRADWEPANRPIPFDESWPTPTTAMRHGGGVCHLEPTFAAARPGRGHLGWRPFTRPADSGHRLPKNIDNLHRPQGLRGEHVVGNSTANTSYARRIGCGQALRSTLGQTANWTPPAVCTQLHISISR